MEDWLLFSLLGICVVVIVFLITIFRKPINCPKCNNELPKFRIPKNLIQLLGGGWTCAKCNCEIDRKGNEVTNKEEHLKKLKKFNLKLVIGAIIFLVIFLIGLYLFIDYSISPYNYSNNPEICEKYKLGNPIREVCFYEMAKKNSDITLCNNTNTMKYMCINSLSKNNTE